MTTDNLRENGGEGRRRRKEKGGRLTLIRCPGGKAGRREKGEGG
jgi:hypothetical protein